MNDSLAITRKKNGRSFAYYAANNKVTDRKLLKWIDSLPIPPAWKDVRISDSTKSKVLAVGYDDAGRRQYIYNPTFRAKQEQLKFNRMLRFAQALPKLRRQVERDLRHKRLGEAKILACIVRLIDEAYFRVGNERYAEENQSYGITTIRSKHLDIEGDTVVFDFVGKSGKEHVKKISDRQIARIIKQLDNLPGYEVFRYEDHHGKLHDVTSKDVNGYIKRYMGEEFSAKDFRTWGGTLIATTELLAAEYSKTKREQQKMVTSIVKNVAKKLGNTPAIARSSYIDPRVLAVYTNEPQLKKVKDTMNSMKPKKYMTRDEQCLLHILNEAV
jgi:DNA topoisomerase-1